MLFFCCQPQKKNKHRNKSTFRGFTVFSHSRPAAPCQGAFSIFSFLPPKMIQADSHSDGKSEQLSLAEKFFQGQSATIESWFYSFRWWEVEVCFFLLGGVTDNWLESGSNQFCKMMFKPDVYSKDVSLIQIKSTELGCLL